MAKIGGHLTAEKDGARAVVGVQSALLATNWEGNSLRQLMNSGRMQGKIFNDDILRGTCQTNIRPFANSLMTHPLDADKRSGPGKTTNGERAAVFRLSRDGFFRKATESA
jgi:hypothetical protein